MSIEASQFGQTPTMSPYLALYITKVGHKKICLCTTEYNNNCKHLVSTALQRWLICSSIMLTYEKIVAMFAKRRTAGLMWREVGLKWPQRIVDDINKREQHKYTASVERHDDSDGTYSIALAGSVTRTGTPRKIAVNIDHGVCTCGQWEVDGMPCAHVHAACHYVGKVADSMVPEKFSLRNYIMSYVGKIMPLPSEDFWPANWYKLLPPQNALRESRPGPYGSTRIPNEMDFNGRRCTLCRGANHDRRTCPHMNRVG